MLKRRSVHRRVGITARLRRKRNCLALIHLVDDWIYGGSVMKSLKLMFVVVLSSAWLITDVSAAQREDHAKQTVKPAAHSSGRRGSENLDA